MVDAGGIVGIIISVAGAFVTAFCAILAALGWQNRRAQLASIRSEFHKTVESLCAAERKQQIAAAVLLRRFFDPASEFGVRSGFFPWLQCCAKRSAPYAAEALNVMMGALRLAESGHQQKTLADGLAYAPSLEGADLQHSNLCNAYLALHRVHGSQQTEKAVLDSADFFKANLSGASLKGVSADGAVFFQAWMRKTVLAKAALRKANFQSAHMVGAQCAHAQLDGADMRHADLQLANMHGASLCKAQLDRADLRSVNLRDALLCNASLRGADLRGADLRGADLCSADFSMVQADDAQFDETSDPFLTDGPIRPQQSGPACARMTDTAGHDNVAELQNTSQSGTASAQQASTPETIKPGHRSRFGSARRQKGAVAQQQVRHITRHWCVNQ